MQNSKGIRNILLIKCRPVGDSILGLGSVQYLRHLLPDAFITYAVSNYACPVFDTHKKDGFEVVGYNVDYHPLKLYSLYKRVKKIKYDLIIELQQRGSTGKFFKLYGFLNNVGYYYNNWLSSDNKFIKDHSVNKNVVQKDIDGIWSALVHFLNDESVEYGSYLDYLPEFRLPVSDPVKSPGNIVLGVSTANKLRLWDINNFKKLIVDLSELSDKLIFYVCIGDGYIDNKVWSEVCRWDFKNIRIVKTHLSRLPYEIRGCSYYIGNDTGVKHLAAAMGMGTFTVFQDERSLMWHPYDLKRHSYIKAGDINNVRYSDVLQGAVKFLGL